MVRTRWFAALLTLATAPFLLTGCRHESVCDGEYQDGEGAWIDGRYDQDSDGYLDAGYCQGVYPAARLDCDDQSAAIHPGRVEIPCNGIDDDCDSATVDDPDGDADGSSYCTDCDDSDASRGAANVEVVDGIDNDCDGRVDNDTEIFDDDGDGYSENDGDCDDGEGSTHPDQLDTRNFKDSDCDGSIDEDAGAAVEPPDLDPGEPGGDAGQATAVYASHPTNAGGATLLAWLQHAQWAGDLDGDGFEDLVMAQILGDREGELLLIYGQAGLAGTDEVQTLADCSIRGEAGPNTVGVGLAAGADLNGDGLADLIVGDNVHRRVGVFLGGARRQGALTLDDADVLVVSGADGALPFGASIAAEDIDGDGMAELFIAQPAWQLGLGRVAVFRGRASPSGVLRFDQADAQLIGPWVGSLYGDVLQGLSDLNGDGYGELLVGSAPMQRLDMLYGSDAPLSGVVAGAELATQSIYDPGTTNLQGLTVAVGDLDGDGLKEVALGLPYQIEPGDEAVPGEAPPAQSWGAVFVHPGSLQLEEGLVPLTRWAPIVLTGAPEAPPPLGDAPPPQPLDFGAGLAIGDLDGDLSAELVVLAPRTFVYEDELRSPRPGHVFVYGAGPTPNSVQLTHRIEGSYGSMEWLATVSIGGVAGAQGSWLTLGAQGYPYQLPTPTVLFFDGADLP